MEIMIGDGMCVMPDRFSFYHLQAQSNTDLLRLAFSLDTWFRRSGFEPHKVSPQIIELCAGFGGMGIGTGFLKTARPC